MTNWSDRRVAPQTPSAPSGQGDLTRDLSELSTRVSRTQDFVVENLDAIRDLKSRSAATGETMERLVERVTTGLESLQESMRSLERRTLETTREIVARLEAAEESTRHGLQQVSTGLALGDALRTSVEAHEIEADMEAAVVELEQRRRSAGLSVEEHRKAYDRAVTEIHRALGEEISGLGALVVELQNELVELLGTVQIDELDPWRHELEVRSAQGDVMRRREQRVSEALQRIDHEGLERIIRGRAAMEELIADHSLADPRVNGEIPAALGVPFIVVRTADSEKQGASSGREIFGPDCLIEDCGDAPQPSAIPRELADRIQEMSARLAQGHRLSAGVIAALKRELTHLCSTGVLSGDDARLVAAHLDAHPLLWLESPAQPS